MSTDRINRKLKDDLETMRSRIFVEMEPIIEKRCQEVVSGLFSKGGAGLSKGNIGGLSAPRGLGGG